MNLKVVDIDGTQIGSKNKINKFVGQNFNLVLNDIRGTDAGSRKKGISTIRQTNPLTPDYMYLGQVELGKDYNPYGKTLHMIKKKIDDIEPTVPKTEMKEKKIVEEPQHRPNPMELGFNNHMYEVYT
jgi:hypothetical protein